MHQSISFFYTFGISCFLSILVSCSLTIPENTHGLIDGLVSETRRTVRHWKHLLCLIIWISSSIWTAPQTRALLNAFSWTINVFKNQDSCVFFIRGPRELWRGPHQIWFVFLLCTKWFRRKRNIVNKMSEFHTAGTSRFTVTDVFVNRRSWALYCWMNSRDVDDGCNVRTLVLLYIHKCQRLY